MLSAQVHAAKILAGKCIVFNDHKLFLALFDMPKAFDSCKTIEYLEEILQPDELHLLNVLTNTPRIYAKFGNELGTVDSQLFVTLLVITQGNYLSAVVFIFYLTYVQTPGVNYSRIHCQPNQSMQM